MNRVNTVMGGKKIENSYTLPSAFYRSQADFDELRDGVFRKAWQYLGCLPEGSGHNVVPLCILPGFIDEPVILSRDKEGNVRCLSNVCTHRGSILVEYPQKGTLLRCPYHGRCFGLDGKFRSMPGFEGVSDFPCEEDNLTDIPLQNIGKMHFAQLAQGESLEHSFGSMIRQMEWVNFNQLELRNEASRAYNVNVHWTLYVDNYLEGFHVPFVHPGLNVALNVGDYKIELHKNSVLQIGFADADETDIITLPETSQYFGQRIYAFYWWVFPNIMFNFYSWGVNVNIVEPINLVQTKIRFLTFVYQDLPTPDVAGIHQTELEDERIIKLVQRGMQSSFYQRGRYSPVHEAGVHHFHNMIKAELNV